MAGLLAMATLWLQRPQAVSKAAQIALKMAAVHLRGLQPQDAHCQIVTLLIFQNQRCREG